MAQYYSLVTAIGSAQIANAVGLGGTVQVTQFAVGTGDNGAEYDPIESQTVLKDEVYRGNVNSISTVDGEPNVLEFHCVVPVSEGGWTVREVGLFDVNGNLLVIAKYPSSYKPTEAEGTAGDFSLKIQVGVVNTDVVQLKVDPAVVLATKKNVADAMTAHENDPTVHPHDHDEDYAPLSHQHAAGDINNLTTVPVGSIIWHSASSPPTGFIKCNGAELDRTTYASLWGMAQASGNLAVDEGSKDTGQFGPGDGVATFTLPDLRGEFIRGWDDSRGVDGGRGFGTSQSDELKSHTHGSGIQGRGTGGPDALIGGSGSGQVTAFGGSETRPRNIALLPCIKF